MLPCSSLEDRIENMRINDRVYIVCWATVFMLLLLVGFSRGAEEAPRQHSKRDKCPVCGMFVYKYPEWVGQIIFKDGTVEFFDGAKDLFKYYFDLKKYNPRKTKADIQAIYVSEYYETKIIRAEDAYFVVGSDIYGPMGKELIAISTQEGAREFLKDHKGEEVLKRMDRTAPLKRRGSPRDIAEAALFILKSNFLTGTVIHVDGGKHLMDYVYGPHPD